MAAHVSTSDPVRRSISVSAVKKMSLRASTIADAATAIMSLPKDGCAPSRNAAVVPAKPAPRVREKVQMTQRVYGLPRSVRRAEAATIIAAYGPKATAAKRIGKAETDIWR